MNDLPRPSEPPDDGQQTSSGQVPGARIGFSRSVMLVTLAVCLCAVVAGVSIAALSSPGGKTRHTAVTGSSPPVIQTPADQPTPPASSSRATTAPEVTSDGIGKSAIQWPPRITHQMLRWKAGHGGAALSAVTIQLGTALQAAGVRLYVTMRLACSRLASSVAAAQVGPPIPEAAMQRLYTKTLAGLSGAAADCRNAIKVDPEGDENTSTSLNRALLNRTLAEFGAASQKLYKATAEIRTLRR